MKRNIFVNRIILVSFCALIFVSTVLAEHLPSAFDPSRHLSLSKVHSGMKGYGLSVFKGTKIERFDVTVLDVIHNFNPKLDVILVELSGKNLKKTGVIAGMSGSPVFLKDPDDGKYKMAGAVAYGWPLSRQGFATGGVQPIQQMLEVDTAKPKKQSTTPTDRKFFVEAMDAITQSSSLKRFDRFVYTGIVNDKIPRGGDIDVQMLPAGLRPLATPICVSGVRMQTIEKLQSVFRSENFSLVMAGSGSGQAGNESAKQAQSQIVPAGVLAVPLVIGDLNLAGIGTVTERIGNRFWGFGHPMFAEGPAELPIGSGVIHSVIANMVSSFKLGSAYKPIGTLYHDQATAVAGQLGVVPKLAPITVNVDFAGKKISYHYQLAMHKKLSPILLLICVNESVLARKDLPELHLVKYTGQLKFEKFAPIKIENTISDVSIKPLLADVAEPTFLMLNNDFETVKLAKVSLNVEVKPISRYAEILQASLDKSSYKPGEKANIILRLARIKKPDFTTMVSFNVPDDLPDGTYSLSIGDMDAALSIDRQANAYLYKPTNIKDVYNMIKHIAQFRSDRFYVMINTKQVGLGLRGYAMPALPGSMLTQLAQAEPGLISKTVQYKKIEVPTKYVIFGNAKLRLKISRSQ